MNIAVLVKSFILAGGAERYAVELTRRLLNRGHRIDLYARYAGEGLTEGLTHTVVPDRCTFSGAANSLSFAREAARLLAGRSYDIVHSHERGYCQDVLTLHTFSYASSLKRYAFLRRLDMTFLSYRSWIYLWLEKRQMASPGLVAVSDLVARDVREQYGRTDGVHVIPPGVDTEWFCPAWIASRRDQARRELAIGPDETVVLFVGSEFRRKGLDLLIPAIGPGMRLVVVGQGERPEHYARLAAGCGAADRIHYAGLVRSDVRSYYAAADAVALPSLSDAFGMSVLEAMACGIPVVTSPGAGAASLVRSGENGFVASDAAGLAAALARLRDPALRRSMGEKARRTAEDHTWAAVAEAYERVFFATLGRKRGRSQDRGYPAGP
jgi:UDP-glucose:(heptosyl)LPS alpha-1,3-glucosyltransferase